MDFRIDLNLEAITAELERFGEKAAGKASARALNRAAMGVRTDGSKQTREHLAVKAKDIKPGLKITRARSGSRPQAVVTISSRPLPLWLFPHTQRPEGVAVKVMKQGSKKVAKHTFIAQMRSGHKGVFIRQRKGGRRVRRLPIDETKTKSLAQVLGDEKRLKKLADVAAERYAKELTNQLRLLQER